MEHKTSSTIELKPTNERDIERRDGRAWDREHVLRKLGEVSVLLGVILAVWLLVCVPIIIIFSTGTEISEVMWINFTVLLYVRSSVERSACIGITTSRIWRLRSMPLTLTVLYNIMLLVCVSFDPLHCPQAQLKTAAGNNCSSSSVPYSSDQQLCRADLISLRTCAGLSTSDILPVNVDSDHSAIDREVNQLVFGVRFLQGSEECEMALKSLLCLRSYGICDRNGNLHVGTFEECRQLKTMTCVAELQRAIEVLGRDPFPSCDVLPDVHPVCIGGNAYISSTNLHVII